ncbi:MULTISPECIES: hypothetical protein [Streptomyces]|uniref:hypothetical protein n=1 Tax=Streptomyces lycopersici TaxID=2974589 RepID=UPI0021CF9DE7|nr:hypothetical protein [Streptomyces sp. NEAU-383]
MRSALMILQAPDRDAVRAVIDTDPFIVQGTLMPWRTERDPYFGAFHHQSRMASAPEAKIGR